MANAHGHSFWNYIIPDPSDGEVLAALLNSSITQMLLEIYGRQYSGMLHVKVYELKRLPVPDPSLLSREERAGLVSSFRELSQAISNRSKVEEKWRVPKTRDKAQETLFKSKMEEEIRIARQEEKDARIKIDRAISKIVGLNEEEESLVRDALKKLRESRKMRTKRPHEHSQ